MARKTGTTLGGTMDILITAVLCTALAIATYTDLKSQRIYNWLTFPLMLTGLIAHTVFGGWSGLGLSAGGFGVGLAVMIVPFIFGMMGAGDVKLMAGVGAWLGTNATFTAFLFTCLVGGLYAIIILLRNFSLFKQVMANIWHTFLYMVNTRKFDYVPVGTEQTLPRLCYGVAIAVGTLGAMLLNYNAIGSVLVR